MIPIEKIFYNILISHLQIAQKTGKIEKLK